VGVKVREKVKGSGEWWVFVSHKGRRTSQKVGNKTAATAVARETEKQLAAGNWGFLKEKTPTLGIYGQKVLGSELKERSDNTTENYERLFKNHVLNHAISKKPVDKIRVRHVKGWIEDLRRKGLAKGSIQLVLAILSGIFEDARVDELVKSNPCTRAGKFIGNFAKKQINPYTAAEAAGLLERSKALGIEAHALITVLLMTGLRIGEALGLDWQDINFEERTALIAKQWDYRRKKLKPTKNKKNREVDLTPYTVQVLSELRDEKGMDGGPVFVGENGHRLSDQFVRGQHEKIRPRDDLTPHDLRHTYATIRIAKGDNIVDVSRQLGHHSAAFTLDRYAHWVPREHKAQVDELDSLHLMHPIRTQGPEKPTAVH